MRARAMCVLRVVEPAVWVPPCGCATTAAHVVLCRGCGRYVCCGAVQDAEAVTAFVAAAIAHGTAIAAGPPSPEAATALDGLMCMLGAHPPSLPALLPPPLPPSFDCVCCCLGLCVLCLHP